MLVNVFLFTLKYPRALIGAFDLELANLEFDHRRNEERGQGGPLAPPIRSKIGKIRSKMGAKSFKMGPFWGMVIHENTCCKTKFKS